MVILAAHVLDIISDIELRDVNSRDENDEIRKINPLGKMPALVSGKNIYYDSGFISFGQFNPTDILGDLSVAQGVYTDFLNPNRRSLAATN